MKSEWQVVGVISEFRGIWGLVVGREAVATMAC